MAGNAIALQPPKAYDLLAAQPASSKGCRNREIQYRGQCGG